MHRAYLKTRQKSRKKPGTSQKQNFDYTRKREFASEKIEKTK